MIISWENNDKVSCILAKTDSYKTHGNNGKKSKRHKKNVSQNKNVDLKIINIVQKQLNLNLKIK